MAGDLLAVVVEGAGDALECGSLADGIFLWDDGRGPQLAGTRPCAVPAGRYMTALIRIQYHLE